MYKATFPAKNELNSINISYTGSYKKFQYILVNSIKILKVHYICVELNKVNMCYSGMQKYICYKIGINNFIFPCTGSHKRLRICFVLWGSCVHRDLFGQIPGFSGLFF